jgi:hypothetical protein
LPDGRKKTLKVKIRDAARLKCAALNKEAEALQDDANDAAGGTMEVPAY